MKQSVESQVFRSISNHKRGKIFFPVNFAKFGASTAVRQALNRLEDKKQIIRLAKGIYLYPKYHKTLGILLPTIDEIAKAIAKRDRARIIPTGAYALNKLGLSTQIPLNVVYLTDGSNRKIKIYSGTIKFKKASPKQLSLKNEIFILIVQSLKEIGKENITKEIERILKSHLKTIRNEELIHDLKLTQNWIRDYVNKILNNEKMV